MKSYEILKGYVEKINKDENLKKETKGMKVFQFKNDLGESYYLQFKDDGSAELIMGEHASPTVVLTAKEEDLAAIIDGSMDGTKAFFMGKLKIKGDPFLAQKLVNVVKKLK
ncbi:MAG: SCP2 sterol-binding domain-containing protein [Thermoplasmata archaeon]|jgi:putative sterol carrier protein|nr:SCP2 sterol-binding domain-containing protein [Thermoplasmata archaeon]MVT13080.1 hypothetical protein [Euryarchaeota archaeon]MVT14213.1 hypothetical protein [Euryarchaeota archaeon]MVT35894.1 hypothetical protein [Euryarchaeota archaeon]